MEESNAKPHRKILIATDGSEASEKAADFGIEILRFSEAKVYAVYVIDTTSYGSIPMDEIWSKEGYEQFEKMGREATSYVEERAKAAGMEAESVLLNGNPAEELVNFAEEQNIDLIIVGSLGKGGFERFVLGSVSEKVVKHAKIPVLVVRERKEEKLYRKILIATDGSKASEKAANFGIEIAKLSGAKIYAVYVIDITYYDSMLMDETWKKEEYERFKKIGHIATSFVEETAKSAGMEAESILLKGNSVEKIVDFAEKQEVDMIVVGSLGKSGIERFVLGSVSGKVVRHAKVPVLVVR